MEFPLIYRLAVFLLLIPRVVRDWHLLSSPGPSERNLRPVSDTVELDSSSNRTNLPEEHVQTDCTRCKGIVHVEPMVLKALSSMQVPLRSILNKVKDLRKKIVQKIKDRMSRPYLTSRGKALKTLMKSSGMMSLSLFISIHCKPAHRSCE